MRQRIDKLKHSLENDSIHMIHKTCLMILKVMYIRAYIHKQSLIEHLCVQWHTHYMNSSNLAVC